MWCYIDVLKHGTTFGYISLCDGDGISTFFSSIRFCHFHSRPFAKQDKIKVFKTYLKINPTNLRSTRGS